MNAGRLLSLYDRVADAPDAVPRLRRFILDLAVRGKLVEQDPSDEPASALMTRIQAAKARRVKAGTIRPRRLRARPREGSIDYVVPKYWMLSNLGTVATKITDGAHKTPTYVDSGIPFVSVKDFSAGRLSLNNTRYIRRSEHDALYKRCDPRRGDILLGRIGTLGSAVIVDTDVEFSLFVSVALIRFDHDHVHPRYLQLTLNSPFARNEFDRIKIGGMTHTNKLNLGDLHSVALPLPPLAEQQRIAAKVDELMALCNELEGGRIGREETRDRLTTAIFSGLTAPDADAPTFRARARRAVDALPALTARVDQIKNLRRTILDLAVRGKLVEQEPADEPPNIGSAEELDIAGASCPVGWQGAQVGSLLKFRYGKGKKASQRSPTGPVPVFGSNGIVGYCEEPLTTAPSIIVGRKGSAGALQLCEGPSWTTDVAYFVEVPDFFSPHYLRMALEALDLPTLGKGVKPGLSRSDAYELPLRVPPLAEQHRIVAKANELTELSDQLEVRLSGADTSRSNLLEALLQAALHPNDANIEDPDERHGVAQPPAQPASA